MATGSTVYAMKAATVTAMDANAALDGVQISHGYPGEGAIKREAIYVDRVTGGHRIPVFRAGRKVREESYTITLVLFVQKDGVTPAVVEARAFTMLQEVEDMLADNPTMDVDGVLHATAGEFREQSDVTPTGAACLIEFDIDVKARLS